MTPVGIPDTCLPEFCFLKATTTPNRKQGALGNKKKRMENGEAEAEPVNCSGGAAAGLWKQEDPRLVGSNIPPIVKPLRSSEDQGKPVPNGYKIWTICTSDGRVVRDKPYCGKDTLIEDQGVGQGPIVVLDLVAMAGMIKGSHVYFDNLFTSLSFAGAAVRSEERGQAEQSAHQRKKEASEEGCP